jgi:hypothetical protein
MSDNILQQIQTLQFTDQASSESLLKAFIRDTFSFDVVSVELRPLAVSLNSFNGFVTLADGKRLFFKTHTEPDNVIAEYYNASRLAEAGYPIIQPVFSSTQAGKQFLIYEVINAPSVFDVAWEIENDKSEFYPALTHAQNDADNKLLQLYMQTLEFQSADLTSQAPVHQLFYHRLVGGRLTRFYGSLPNQAEQQTDPTIHLPSGQHKMSHVRQIHWQINGQTYDQTLNELIARATQLLHPTQAGMSIIGHGDAHNGNVFLQLQDTPASLLYFDPAFAGRHDPLLDLTKPLFHNVFAMWMYFPQVKTQQTPISLQTDDRNWYIEYEYPLHPVRLMLLQSKVERVLLPILKELKGRNQLRADWRTYLKAALFCCPFLTMNLTDTAKFTPQVSLLGLAMAVEMGAESGGKRSLVDQTLDEVAGAIT